MTRRFMTFVLDDRCYGLDVAHVREVLRAPDIVPVPLAMNHVAGLMNLRGQIITVIDLRSRLGLPERGAGEDPAFLAVVGEGGDVGLLVDDVRGVWDVDDGAFEAPPATLRGEIRAVSGGVFKLPTDLLLELELDKVLEMHA